MNLIFCFGDLFGGTLLLLTRTRGFAWIYLTDRGKDRNQGALNRLVSKSISVIYRVGLDLT